MEDFGGLSKGCRITKSGVIKSFLGRTITHIRNSYSRVKVYAKRKLEAGLLCLVRSLDQDH